MWLLVILYTEIQMRKEEKNSRMRYHLSKQVLDYLDYYHHQPIQERLFEFDQIGCSRRNRLIADFRIKDLENSEKICFYCNYF